MPLKDPIKRKEYETKWRREHKELCRKWRTDWDKNNPLKKKQMDKNYRENNPWIINFTDAKQRCTNKNHTAYKYYGGKGIKFELTLKEIKILWLRDNAFEMEKPSIDRKNAKLNYTFDNCRFLEHRINSSRRLNARG